MALLTRISRLFRADIHAVLDRVEEPGVLLRQAIREMEEAHALDEQRFKLSNHEQAQLGTRKADLERALEQIAEELDVCFTAGNDDLARTLIKRKLETRRHVRFVTGKQESLQAKLTDLATRLEDNRTRLDSMRQKAELLSEDDAPTSPEEQWSAPDFSIGEADVEVAFLREKQRRNPS